MQTGFGRNPTLPAPLTPGLLQEGCMGSMGSFCLPRMALLKVKPGLFYINSGLKTKVPFAALKSV